MHCRIPKSCRWASCRFDSCLIFFFLRPRGYGVAGRRKIVPSRSCLPRLSFAGVLRRRAGAAGGKARSHFFARSFPIGQSVLYTKAGAGRVIGCCPSTKRGGKAHPCRHTKGPLALRGGPHTVMKFAARRLERQSWFGSTFLTVLWLLEALDHNSLLVLINSDLRLQRRGSTHCGQTPQNAAETTLPGACMASRWHYYLPRPGQQLRRLCYA